MELVKIKIFFSLLNTISVLQLIDQRITLDFQIFLRNIFLTIVMIVQSDFSETSEPDK